MCVKTDSCTPDESIYHSCHVSNIFFSLCESQSANCTVASAAVCPEDEHEPDCFGHCRCLFSCHSLQPVSSLFSDSLLFCRSPTHSEFASPPQPPLSPLPSPLSLLSALTESSWPLGLASLSLCHVCNLNRAGAKQGWATSKAFHKTRLSLWSLPGPCSVRNEMGLHILIFLSEPFHFHTV